MSYLVKESTQASGVFSAPLAVDCRSRYALLQIDSSGRIYIVEESFQVSHQRHHGPLLFVSESDDGGTRWKRRKYLLPEGPNGLPRASTDTWQPTLTKPWDDPRGYRPNVLHGFLANWRPSPRCDNGRAGPNLNPDPARCTWSAAEFTIPTSDQKRHHQKRQ